MTMQFQIKFNQQRGIDAALELPIESLQAMVIRRALKNCYHLDVLVFVAAINIDEAVNHVV